jgi:hypothetical protein
LANNEVVRIEGAPAQASSPVQAAPPPLAADPPTPGKAK